MHTPQGFNHSSLTRRDFVKTSAAAAAAVTLPAWAIPADAEQIRVGIIGCGGRGIGAAMNLLDASQHTRIVALADVFADRVASGRTHLAGRGDRATVPQERCFSGFDAYQALLNEQVDLVVLATPPHFRPIHFEAAVNAGVHVFLEKPVAVDAVGVRRVLATSQKAKEAGLSVVAGTQRRYEQVYLEALQRVRDGQIGQIVDASCYWNMGGLWKADRRPQWTDMEWQLRNWLYFTWLSGDHIVEQHVHNLDVINWFTDATPTRCLGMGGRQVRTSSEFGHIFDHFAVEYEYASGLSVTSFCRQIDGCDSRVQERIRGTLGTLTIQPGWAQITGQRPWQFVGENNNPYLDEQKQLIDSIVSRRPINDGFDVALSTLTAIMGRMSAYTGKEVTWDQAINSQEDLSPASYVMAELPIPPVPMPGRTPLL